MRASRQCNNHFLFTIHHSVSRLFRSEQAVEKVKKRRECHSERSEESRFFKVLRPFALLRVTRKECFSTACEDVFTRPFLPLACPVLLMNGYVLFDRFDRKVLRH